MKYYLRMFLISKSFNEITSKIKLNFNCQVLLSFFGRFVLRLRIAVNSTERI